MKIAGLKEKINRFPGKITEFFAGIKSVFPGLFTGVLPFFAKIKGFFTDKANLIKTRFLETVPEKKRRPAIFVLGGLFSLLLVLIISTLALNSSRPKENTSVSRFAGIPHEELFYPAEPDFLPDFLLDREPRRYWTAEDIRPYWKVLASSEFWQREIKASVDRLMEGVP